MVESRFKKQEIWLLSLKQYNQNVMASTFSLSSNVFHIYEGILFVKVKYLRNTKRKREHLYTNYDCSSFKWEMPQSQQTAVKKKYSNLVQLQKNFYMNLKSSNVKRRGGQYLIYTLLNNYNTVISTDPVSATLSTSTQDGLCTKTMKGMF